MKRISYGISNFELLRNKGYLTNGFIVMNYTLDENLNGKMGFTREELVSVIDEVSINDINLRKLVVLLYEFKTSN